MSPQDETLHLIQVIADLGEKGATYATRMQRIIARLTPITQRHDQVAAEFNTTPSLEGLLAISKIDQEIRGLVEEMGEAAHDLMVTVRELNTAHIQALKLISASFASLSKMEPKSHEAP